MGFVVLCPNSSIGQLKKTTESIKTHYNKEMVVVVPDEKVVGDSINAMINKGVQSLKADWALIFIAQGRIRSGIDVKYSYFVDSDKDILFPVVNKHMNFVDAGMNGCFLRRDAFLDIGNIKEGPNGKLLWTFSALEKGYKFKGIIGAKLY